jgi:hypothetical protein
MDMQMDMNDLQACAKSTAMLPDVNRAARSVHSLAEIDFSSDSGMACCGEELRPFWAEDGRYMGVCRRCGQKYIDKTQVRYKSTPWIGVDLDGTLAHDLSGISGNKGLGEIGSPIKPMLNRLLKWIAEGKTVKIFTARASSPKQVALVKKWLMNHGLPDLEVTNVKDLRMIELWDDRCVQVMTNSGEPINQNSVCHRGRQPGRRGTSKMAPFSMLSRLRIFLTL